VHQLHIEEKKEKEREREREREMSRRLFRVKKNFKEIESVTANNKRNIEML